MFFRLPLSLNVHQLSVENEFESELPQKEKIRKKEALWSSLTNYPQAHRYKVCSVPQSSFLPLPAAGLSWHVAEVKRLVMSVRLTRSSAPVIYLDKLNG